MKHFLLLLLAAIALISCSEDSNPVNSSDVLVGNYFSPKKITVYNSNQTTEEYNFTHNSSGLVLSEVRDSTERFLYTYNSNRKPLTKTHDLFYNGSWQNSDSTLYSYDSQNNLLHELVRSENQSAFKKKYTYNGHNLKLSETIWVGSMGLLTPNYRFNYNYIDTMMISSTRESYASGSWHYTDRSTYFHNESGRLDSILSEDYFMSNWQKYYLLTNSYNSAGKIVTQIIQLWNGSVWYNYFRATNSYDANQCLTASVVDNYNSSTGAWMPSAKREFQYNSKKIMSKVECFGYNNNSWQPVSNSVSLTDSDYPFSANGYKMEVEYAGFFNSSNSARKLGQIDSPLNEMFERLVKEKMATKRK